MSSAENEMVILVRLDATHGFQNMADALEFVAQLQREGIDAIAESPPGAPMDGAEVFYIKVPVHQRDLAEEYLSNLEKA